MEHLCFTGIRLAEFHVFCCRTFIALDNVETHGLSLGQGLEAAGLNGTEMDENVPALTLLDKPKTFTLVKTFHFTF
jgi:hypothetical protein